MPNRLPLSSVHQAIALQRSGYPAKAVEALRRIAKSPADRQTELAALATLGSLLHDLGRLDEAISAYRSAIRIQLNDPALRYNLGIVLKDAGQYLAAVEAYRHAVRLAPGFHQAFNNLGTALRLLDRMEEAIAAFRKAIELSPQFAQAHNNLGNALAAIGTVTEAEAAFTAALAARPDYADAMANLAALYKDTGRLAEAELWLKRTLQGAPSHAHALCTLGQILQATHRAAEAVEVFHRALASNPSLPQALRGLGVALWSQGDLTAALAAYRRALDLDRRDTEALSNLMHLRQHACDWAGLPELQREVLVAVRRKRLGVPPFYLLSVPEATPADQLACAREFCSPMAAIRPMLPRPLLHGNDRIRIGYLSADFRPHPIAYLMAEVFERHDRDRFAVFGYSIGPNNDSTIRTRIAHGCDVFAECSGLSDPEAAERIRSDRIDLLVDLTGHTDHGRLRILAHRPAPIQIAYLGFPGTIGADFVDYAVADWTVTPGGEEGFYTEKLARMPLSYQLNDSTRLVAEPPGREDEGLPAKGFVFCSFNNAYKISPEVFTAWMDLLTQVPESVLWLLKPHPLAEENLKAAASARGVDPQRLVFAPWASAERHLARQRLADLFVDTLPYNAHTGTSDALWAGLPVVTCRGATFAGRVAASLLKSAGLEELVTDSLDAYVTLAVGLARDSEGLTAIRKKLAAPQSLPLFDIPSRVRELEGLYETMMSDQGMSRSMLK